MCIFLFSFIGDNRKCTPLCRILFVFLHRRLGVNNYFVFRSSSTSSLSRAPAISSRSTDPDPRFRYMSAPFHDRQPQNRIYMLTSCSHRIRVQVINNFVHHNGDWNYGLYNEIKIDRKPLLDKYYGDNTDTCK